MSEPTLNDMSDYNTLSGQKRKVVWAVVLAGLIIGTIYVVSYNYFGNVDDSIEVEQSIKSVPVK